MYSAYWRFNFLKKINYIEQANVVSIERYWPVAVATLASTPNISSTGPKMKPGPIPLNPAAMAPTKDIAVKKKIAEGVAYRSPGENWYPHSFFSLYSFLTILIPR